MKTIKGPAIFLAQFVGDEKPFNDLQNICKWAKGLGYKAVQIPTWDSRLIDIKKAGESKAYCDEIKGIVNSAGLEISELSTHLQGQLVASHYAYDKMFDAFAPKELHGNVNSRTRWAVNQIKSVEAEGRLENLKELVNAISDSSFAHPIDTAAKINAIKSQEPTYMYHFGYKGSNSFSQLDTDTYPPKQIHPQMKYGVGNGDDLIYLFPVLSSRERLSALPPPLSVRSPRGVPYTS